MIKLVFKSRIPLQTPIAVKLLLSSILITLLVGWSLKSEASSQKSLQGEDSIVNKTKLKNSYSNRELTQIAKRTYQQVNQYRASLGLEPLKFNNAIAKQAKIHSRNMAQQSVEFSHRGFQKRVEAIAKTIPYRSAAENVAYNMGHNNPVNTAVTGWIKSDGHRKNIEGDYNLTGVGVAVNPAGEYYFTQIFILEN